MNEKEQNVKVKTIEERIDALSEVEFQKLVQIMRKKLHAENAVYLNSCVHCGLCAESCHYYLTDENVKSLPAYKLSLITKVFKNYFTKSGKFMPHWVDAQELDREMIKEWIDVLFGRCSLCGRCTINCTIGINIAYLIMMARGMLSEVNLIPAGLEGTVKTAIEKGNNMGIPQEEWIETLEWIEDELKDDLNDENARIPIDKKGAKFLYVLNPREPMFFPMSLSAIAKIFHVAKEDWTFASDYFDMTNYGLYTGKDELSAIMSERLVETMERLGCETLVLAECGHGFNANRWEGPEWLKRKYTFQVKSILEIVAQYIHEGRIKLDPSKNKEPVTLHDPCNLVRYGGIVEEQRYI
ncbi:MAG: hypothetical protein A2Y62_01565, partial [Candidatus Fischerbacteria bacterium RBG_13_37_8]